MSKRLQALYVPRNDADMQIFLGTSGVDLQQAEEKKKKANTPWVSLSDSPPTLYPAAADLGRIYAAQSQRLH